MREILFRGKQKASGEWVCGDLIHSLGRIYCGIYGETLAEVDPATVGQYTGLTDKNGKRIFEGDILQDIDGSTQAAIFDRGAFVGRYAGYAFNDDEFYNNEVIGNIHDNPELLEGGAAE